MKNGKENQEIVNILKLFGVPDECPVPPKEVKTNPDQSYSLDKYKQYLMMAEGNAIINAKIKHDNGESCFKINLDVTKPIPLVGK